MNNIYKHLFDHEYMSMKFDVIVGNPPYQETKEHGKKVTGNGALWVKFTEVAFDKVKDDGIVSFVIPDSILAPTYDKMGSRISLFNDLLKVQNLTYLNLDVKKYFQSVGIYPIAFVCEKNNDYKSTEVKTSDGHIDIDISQMTFVPKDYNSISLSIHRKILSSNENENLFKMRWSKEVVNLSKNENKSDTYQYEVLDSHSFKPLRWSDTKDPDFEEKKVLVTRTGKYQCVVDDGRLGADNYVSVRFLQENETVESANSFYNSKLINYVMNSNKWTQYLLAQILNYIPAPPLDNVYSNQDVYDYFGLTQEEIDYIEKNVK